MMDLTPRTLAVRAAGAVVLAAAFLPRPSSAAPGDHVRLGDAVLSPSLYAGMAGHTNAYLASGSSLEEEVPALAFVLRPTMKLELKGEQASLQTGVGYSLKKFIDIEDDDYNTQNLDRFNEVDANLALDALTRGIVGIKLDDSFAITDQPAALAQEPGSATSNIVHIGNDLSGGLQFRPGTAIDVNAVGILGADSYELPPSLSHEASTSYNSKLSYGPALSTAWRFLPKTSVNAYFSYTWIDWGSSFVRAPGDEAQGSNVGRYVGKPDSQTWRALAGLKGQFTEKLAAEVSAGYGQATYDEETVIADAAGTPDSSTELDSSGAESFATDLTSFGDGLLVVARLGYAPLKWHTLSLGYKKDFQDAVFTNYVTYNSIFMEYRGTFAERLGVGLEFSYRIDDYHGEISRDDNNVETTLDLSYRATDFLALGLTGDWRHRACVATDCDDDFYGTQYDDVSGQLGLTLSY